MAGSPCGTALVIFGVLLALAGVLVRPVVVPRILAKQLTLTNTGSARYKAFLGSDGQPPRYWKFYLYNVTNFDEFQAGEKPALHLLGPYTYKQYTERYDISFSGDEEEVSFRELQRFNFEPSMSVGSESDVITTVNVVFAAAAQACYHLGQFSDDAPSSTLPSATCSMTGTCFKLSRNVTSHLFARTEKLINIPGKGWASDHFQLFFNFTSTEECTQAYENEHYFGLGGKCSPFTTEGTPPMVTCRDTHRANGTMVTTVKTGKSDGGRSSNTLTRYMGNTSISFDYNSTAGPDAAQALLPNAAGALQIQGTDGTSFRPFVRHSDTLHVFDPNAMRALPLRFAQDTEVEGVSALRFEAAADAFPEQGMINITNVASIRYGQPCPIHGSRPLMDKVTHPLAGLYTCDNCDAVIPASDREPFATVDSLSGVTLDGRLRVQLNAHVGMGPQYGRPNMTNCVSGECPLMNVPEMFLPYIIVDQGATATEEQTGPLRLLQTLNRWGLWGLLGVGMLLIVVGFVLVRRAQRQAHEEDNGNRYSSIADHP